MHDPMTVAFDLRFLGVTIWHVDPETDGSDDSCGWFKRSRHGDAEILKKIEQEFCFEWTHGCPSGWFNKHGDPMYSTQAIALNMMVRAVNIVFGHWSRKAQRFLTRNLWDILFFGENNVDSLFTEITQPYGRDRTEEERIKESASIVYGWILRKACPWYSHPRWHFWHWKIQIGFVLKFKRWAFSRCAVCGKPFRWGESPVAYNWHGTGPLWFKSEEDVTHTECNGQHPAVVQREVKENA